MPGQYGWKRIVIPVGGLALLGVLVWGCIHFGMAYSRGGGAGNLAGLLVCVFVAAAALSMARRLLK